MSKKLAIKGHPTRGKEVIELLEMLGGVNVDSHKGHFPDEWKSSYYIYGDNTIQFARDEFLLKLNFVIFTLEEFLEKFPFKVGDKVYIKVDPNANCLGSEKIYGEIESAMWVEKFGHVVYKLKDYSGIFYREELHPHEEEVSMEDNKVKGYCTKAPEKCNETKKIAWFKFWDNDFADKVELDLNDRELIQENGKWFVVKKKPIYPKTYAECCEVLDYCGDYFLTTYDNNGNPSIISNILNSINILTKLLICRDAYWKIAGEEMGLGKPWEPDWNEETDKFTISNKCNKIYLNNTAWYAEVLSFPTEEMRDTFFKNFKDLIKLCKELL